MDISISFYKKLTTILLVAGLIWATWLLHDVFLIIFLAIIVAIGISVPLHKLQRYGLSRNISLLISVILVSSIFLGLIVWLVPLMVVEIQKLLQALPELLRMAQVQYAGTGFGDLLESVVGNGSNLITNTSSADLSQVFERFVGGGLPFVFSSAGILISVITNLFIVLVVAVMLLLDPKAYIRSLLFLLPKTAHKPFVNLANKIYLTLKLWLSSLSISIVFTTVVVFFGMLIIGVPNAAAIALLAALATFIPNIGAIIPVIPIALFTVTISPQLTLIAIAVYLGIQLIEGNVFTPMVMKSQLDIPVAGILIFQIIAGVLFGLLGVLLAVPLLATLIVILKELVSKHYYGYESDDVNLKTDTENRLVLDDNLK